MSESVFTTRQTTCFLGFFLPFLWHHGVSGKWAAKDPPRKLLGEQKTQIQHFQNKINAADAAFKDAQLIRSFTIVLGSILF